MEALSFDAEREPLFPDPSPEYLPEVKERKSGSRSVLFSFIFCTGIAIRFSVFW
jgi:hypothetical protein